MLLIEVLALVLAKVGEHGAIIHVVAIQNQVVGNTNVAVFLHIGNAVAAVRFIKGVLQIKVGVVFGLHNGVINPGSGDGNPAHQIAVLGIHIGILVKGRHFLLHRLLFAFQLQSRQLRLLFYQLGHFFKGFGTLLLVKIFPAEHKAGEKEKGGTKGRPSDHHFGFHFFFHVLPSCAYRVLSLPGSARCWPDGAAFRAVSSVLTEAFSPPAFSASPHHAPSRKTPCRRTKETLSAWQAPLCRHPDL